MTRALPPSPEYYRDFVGNWCGHPDRPIVVVEGDRYPHGGADGNRLVVFVGADWLKRQAIPREALS